MTNYLPPFKLQSLSLVGQGMACLETTQTVEIMRSLRENDDNYCEYQ